MMPPEFKNEPLSDFSNPDVVSDFKKALDKVRGELGREYPLIVGSEKITTDAKIKSVDPANPPLCRRR